MWLKFNSSPTVTAVKDTHLALYSLPFPAVNVCPMDKIKRSEAYKYVADRTNNATYEESEMDTFLNILTLFQHPLYSRMLYYLNRGMDGFLPKLTSINITDFMLKVSVERCSKAARVERLGMRRRISSRKIEREGVKCNLF